MSVTLRPASRSDGTDNNHSADIRNIMTSGAVTGWRGDWYGLRRRSWVMLIDEWLARVGATKSEATELRWYLAFIRWRKSMKTLFRIDA